MDGEKPKTNLAVYLLASCHASFVLSSAWLVPWFRGYFEAHRVATSSRIVTQVSRLVLSVPAVGWIALAVIVPGALRRRRLPSSNRSR